MIRSAELAAIKAGDVDLAFRRWDRPRVVVGTRMRTAVGLLEVTTVDPVEDASLTEDDARRAGSTSLAALLRRCRRDRTLRCSGSGCGTQDRTRGWRCARPCPTPTSWRGSRRRSTGSTGPPRSASGPGPPSTWSTGIPG